MNEHRWLQRRFKEGLKGGLKGRLQGGLKGGFKAGLQGGLQGMNLVFFVKTPLKRFRVAFSCLWGGEHVFVHVCTAASRGFEEKPKRGLK